MFKLFIEHNTEKDGLSTSAAKIIYAEKDTVGGEEDSFVHY